MATAPGGGPRDVKDPDIGIEIGRHGPGGLAVAEYFGHAVADLLESVDRSPAQALVPQQLTPGLNGATEELVDGNRLPCRIDGQGRAL